MADPNDQFKIIRTPDGATHRFPKEATDNDINIALGGPGTDQKFQEPPVEPYSAKEFVQSPHGFFREGGRALGRVLTGSEPNWQSRVSDVMEGIGKVAAPVALPMGIAASPAATGLGLLGGYLGGKGAEFGAEALNASPENTRLAGDIGSLVGGGLGAGGKYIPTPRIAPGPMARAGFESGGALAGYGGGHLIGHPWMGAYIGRNLGKGLYDTMTKGGPEEADTPTLKVRPPTTKIPKSEKLKVDPELKEASKVFESDKPKVNAPPKQESSGVKASSKGEIKVTKIANVLQKGGVTSEDVPLLSGTAHLDNLAQNLGVAKLSKADVETLTKELSRREGLVKKSTDVEKKTNLNREPDEVIPPGGTSSTKDALLRAAQELGGQKATQIRLQDLRSKLPDFSREQIDATIRELQNEQILSVIPFDLPRDIKPLDKEAAINIAGTPRHAIIVRDIPRASEAINNATKTSLPGDLQAANPQQWEVVRVDPKTGKTLSVESRPNWDGGTTSQQKAESLVRTYKGDPSYVARPVSKSP